MVASLAAPAVAAPQPASCAIAAASSMQKVFPDSGLSNFSASAKISGARGETAVFQAALRCAGSGTPALAPIIDSEDPVFATVEYLRVAHVNVTQASNAANRTGAFPDPLVPINASGFPAQGALFATSAVWVTIRIPTDAAAPASHNASLSLYPSAPPLAIELRVRNYTVPPAGEARQWLDSQFSPGGAANARHGGSYDALTTRETLLD
jgi:hypothetical protein